MQTVKVATFFTFITSTSFLDQFLFMPTIFCKKTPNAGRNQRTNADLYRNIGTLKSAAPYEFQVKLLSLRLKPKKINLHLRRFLEYELWLWAKAKLWTSSMTFILTLVKSLLLLWKHIYELLENFDIEKSGTSSWKAVGK